MFKSKKKKIKTIYLCLIAFIGLLFICNNHQVMAMQNSQAKKFGKTNNNLQIIYNINISQNNSFKNSCYIKDKNLSLEDMSNNINILNSIKKILKKDKENWSKLKKSNSI
ncbi:SVM family protein ['Fragaria x ananassa' phyllody phytoplasma]|uniref:SVM family protein n=1 Tax='Fragaria x ananassa' phyllody phytoplasma TaxID=2358428 RepID=A0ABS5K3H8_9MOLU|nr:SVM family protein ['Fragaria x ananassa' phyllody phytoplasma]MBS2126471.1 SVM family protein ['Fragaria x ananassa' phyllody phytoplasma]